MKSSLFRNILQFGIGLGPALCLYTKLMWLTKLDSTYLRVGQYLDIAIALLPVGLILAALRRQRALGGRLTPGQRLGIAVGVGVVAHPIYAPFLYAYHHHINPNWFSCVLTIKRQALEAAGQSAGGGVRGLPAFGRYFPGPGCPAFAAGRAQPPGYRLNPHRPIRHPGGSLPLSSAAFTGHCRP